MTVDGGTNKWDSFLSSLSEEEQESMKAPDIITGDFDSITDEVLERYKKKGCKVKLYLHFYVPTRIYLCPVPIFKGLSWFKSYYAFS